MLGTTVHSHMAYNVPGTEWYQPVVLSARAYCSPIPGHAVCGVHTSTGGLHDSRLSLPDRQYQHTSKGRPFNPLLLKWQKVKQVHHHS
jgi:hypothetical protein